MSIVNSVSHIDSSPPTASNGAAVARGAQKKRTTLKAVGERVKLRSDSDSESDKDIPILEAAGLQKAARAPKQSSSEHGPRTKTLKDADATSHESMQPKATRPKQQVPKTANSTSSTTHKEMSDTVSPPAPVAVRGNIKRVKKPVPVEIESSDEDAL